MESNGNRRRPRPQRGLPWPEMDANGYQKNIEASKHSKEQILIIRLALSEVFYTLKN